MNDTHAVGMKRSSGASKVPFPSPRVQRLQRPSIVVSYVTPDWYFSSGVRNLFVFRAYTTMRVRLCLFNMSSVFEWYVWK